MYVAERGGEERIIFILKEYLDYFDKKEKFWGKNLSIRKFSAFGYLFSFFFFYFFIYKDSMIICYFSIRSVKLLVSLFIDKS